MYVEIWATVYLAVAHGGTVSPHTNKVQSLTPGPDGVFLCGGCIPCAWVGFLQLLQFPPQTSKTLLFSVN